MASEIIKRVRIKATFPGGRVVEGFTRQHPERTDEPFQIWKSESKADSILVNPLFAETVEINFEYEK